MDKAPASPTPVSHNPIGVPPIGVPPPFPNPRAHVEFYETFKRDIDAHDGNSTTRFDDHMSIVAIFGCFFSVVTSIFIVDVQSQLRPDYAQMNNLLLTVSAGAPRGGFPTAAPPPWTGPDPATIHVQSMLYLSLATSLLAAFAAILSKQWLGRYSQARIRGSIVDEGRYRLAKFSVLWRLHLVTECLPFMLLASFLFLVYALSSYLTFINDVIAGAIVVSVAFTLFSYSLTTFTAAFSSNYPLQIPLFATRRSLTRSDDEHVKCFESSQWLGGIFSWGKRRSQLESRETSSSRCKTLNEKEVDGRLGLATTGVACQPPLFNHATDWSGYVLDSSFVAWVLDIPTEEYLMQTILEVVPEIVWHAGIRTTPLEKLYDILFECFDCSSKRPVLIPTFRRKAYLSARAFLHLAIQRKCFGYESDKAAFESILDRHQILGHRCYWWDVDLESTLSVIDRVLGDNFEPIIWGGLLPSLAHHTWMGHILLYRAWDVTSKGGRLPDDVRRFVSNSLQQDASLGMQPVAADCLFIIGLVLGMRLHIRDLQVTDKGPELFPQINRIYDKLFETFQNPHSTSDEIDRAIETMELIAPLRAFEVFEKGYPLFQVIMEAPVSLAYTQEKKWEASRFAMRGAFKWDTGLPGPVEDIQGIPTFLGHHVDLALEGDEGQDEPIRNALVALAFATAEALENLDPTEPSFVRGMCYALQDDKPFILRKAAIAFLPLIGDRWFDTTDPIMDADQMKSLCIGWASAVDSVSDDVKVRGAIFKALFGMMNSPHWRPHIVMEKWKLLAHFPWALADSEPLKKCLDNPKLITALSEMENSAVLTDWLTILWLKYKELVPEVRERLETVTGEIAQSGRTGVVVHLEAIDSELTKAGDELANHDAWSSDPCAVSRRTKVENLKQAKAALVALERD